MEHRYRVVVVALGLDHPGRSLTATERALRDAGLEVIAAGRAANPEAATAVVVQEDAEAVVAALPDAEGALLTALGDALHAEGREDAVLVGLGPRTTPDGVDAVFPIDTPIDTITDWLVAALGRREERLEALA